MEPQTLVFFGIIGSGKGTQIKLLIDLLKNRDARECVYAYPGDEYRRLVQEDNFTGRLIKDSMHRGHLQPDFLTTSIVTNVLAVALNPEKHLIFDGYPRTPTQAEALDAMINFFQRKDVKIIYIELSEEEAMKRNLARGRRDDTPEGIAKRFDEYINKVVPAMDYFKDKNNYTIYTINGNQSIEQVQSDIVKAIGL
ncbi:MAG: nucleoside monophosphate kinase [Candidatus Paceibacterota bacterium]